MFGLLEDIFYIGLSVGLMFNIIKLVSEISKEFYVELLIDIEVKGGFYFFGVFVSVVVLLLWIVMLYDFEIKLDGKF